MEPTESLDEDWRRHLSRRNGKKVEKMAIVTPTEKAMLEAFEGEMRSLLENVGPIAYDSAGFDKLSDVMAKVRADIAQVMQLPAQAIFGLSPPKPESMTKITIAPIEQDATLFKEDPWDTLSRSRNGEVWALLSEAKDRGRFTRDLLRRLDRIEHAPLAAPDAKLWFPFRMGNRPPRDDGHLIVVRLLSGQTQIGEVKAFNWEGPGFSEVEGYHSPVTFWRPTTQQERDDHEVMPF